MITQSDIEQFSKLYSKMFHVDLEKSAAIKKLELLILQVKAAMSIESNENENYDEKNKIELK